MPFRSGSGWRTFDDVERCSGADYVRQPEPRIGVEPLEILGRPLSASEHCEHVQVREFRPPRSGLLGNWSCYTQRRTVVL
jgi:hypothetical protein